MPAKKKKKMTGGVDKLPGQQYGSCYRPTVSLETCVSGTGNVHGKKWTSLSRASMFTGDSLVKVVRQLAATCPPNMGEGMFSCSEKGQNTIS